MSIVPALAQMMAQFQGVTGQTPSDVVAGLAELLRGQQPPAEEV